MKKESTFASKAKVGEKYLSKSGYPVRVMHVGEKKVDVKNLASGIKTTIDAATLLRPFSEEGISKDARETERAYKVKNRKTGKPRVERLEKSIARVDGKRVIKRTYKGKELEMTVNAEGFHVAGKTYPSLTSAAQGVTGTKITTGPKFWGFAK